MKTVTINHANAIPVFAFPVHDSGHDLSIKQARAIAGPLGYPSKMPGTSYGISARKCISGTKLAKIQGSTCHGCYALKGNYLYHSVDMAHESRFNGLRHPRWVAAMVRMLSYQHSLDSHGNPRKGRNGTIVPGFHRWHDAGDIQSVQHLANICAVAFLTPQIRHWLPTREGTMVRRYRDAGGIIPVNLTIRISATMVNGPVPSYWPTTSGVHKDSPAIGHDCPARFQDGKCGSCRACWSRDVPRVDYPLH
jgi:hypothetical protein